MSDYFRAIKGQWCFRFLAGSVCLRKKKGQTMATERGEKLEYTTAWSFGSAGWGTVERIENRERQESKVPR